jgi:predicted transcriptional regulator
VAQNEDQKITFAPDVFIIPAVVMVDQKLRPIDVKIYGCIYWLERLRDGKCYASNKMIASVIGTSSQGVADGIMRLRDAGYIECVYEDEEKKIRKQIITRIHMMSRVSSNEEGGFLQMKNRDSNNEINTLSETELQQITTIHRQYVLRFIIDQNRREYAAPDELEKLVDDAIKSQYRLTPKRKSILHTRLKDAGYEMIKQALTKADKDPWMHGSNERGWVMDLYEYLLRSYEQVEKWARK